jgi:hypothetical protein
MYYNCVVLRGSIKCYNELDKERQTNILWDVSSGSTEITTYISINDIYCC